MSTRLRRVVSSLPLLPKAVGLSWQKCLVERAFRSDIAAAKKAKDTEMARSLERDRRVNIDLIEEEEDQLLSRDLVRDAWRLRVPIPHRFRDDGTPSECWSEGQLGWHLTTEGISGLREEIRKERRARHESRALWLPWLSALIGAIGALTGLIAVLFALK